MAAAPRAPSADCVYLSTQPFGQGLQGHARRRIVPFFFVKESGRRSAAAEPWFRPLFPPCASQHHHVTIIFIWPVLVGLFHLWTGTVTGCKVKIKQWFNAPGYFVWFLYCHLTHHLSYFAIKRDKQVGPGSCQARECYRILQNASRHAIIRVALRNKCMFCLLFSCQIWRSSYLSTGFIK